MDFVYMSRRERIACVASESRSPAIVGLFFCFTSGVILLCPMPSVTAIGASKSKFWFGNFCELKD
jgi:hypothetical protein